MWKASLKIIQLPPVQVHRCVRSLTVRLWWTQVRPDLFETPGLKSTVPFRDNVSEHFHWRSIATMPLTRCLRAELSIHMLWRSTTPETRRTTAHYMTGSRTPSTDNGGALCRKSLAWAAGHVIQTGCCWYVHNARYTTYNNGNGIFSHYFFNYYSIQRRSTFFGALLIANTATSIASRATHTNINMLQSRHLVAECIISSDWLDCMMTNRKKTF